MEAFVGYFVVNLDDVQTMGGRWNETLIWRHRDELKICKAQPPPPHTHPKADPVW